MSPVSISKSLCPMPVLFISVIPMELAPERLWYIRRLTVDGVDSQAAKHEADELEAVDKDFWAATTAYLNQAKPSSAPAPAASSPVAPDPKDAKPNPSAAAAQPAVALGRAPRLCRTAESEPAAPTAVATGRASACPEGRGPTRPPPRRSPRSLRRRSETQEQLEPRPRDTTVWRTCAAMVVTGLGVPLAYWSRSSLDSLRTMARASLPGPEPKSKSLPPASVIEAELLSVSAIRGRSSLILRVVTAPYLRSPTIGHPRAASWTRI